MQIGVLRYLLFVLVALLVVQFMLGVFVSFYPIGLQVNVGFFSYTGTGLGVHHYVAASVLIFAVIVMVSSFFMKSSLLSKLSIIGLLLLVGAFASGLAFVYLQKSNFYAIAMGTCFILALVLYTSSIFLVKK